MGRDFILMEVLRGDWYENAEERLGNRWPAEQASRD
jgi:hypothetical protein